MKTSPGFSLFEILVAMAIVSLGMAIAAPPVTTMLDKLSFRKEVGAVMAQVRGWKLLAVSTGKPVTVSLRDNILTVQLARQEKKESPVHAGLQLAMEPDQLRFSPEGWASPATIRISRKQRSQQIGVDPLTGQPRLR